MGDWIRAHKAISVIVISALGIALVAVVAFGIGKLVKGIITSEKESNKPTQSSEVSSDSFWSDRTDESTSETETENSTESTTESTTEVKNESTTVFNDISITVSQTFSEPTGVSTKTDGNKKIYYPAALEVTQKKYPVIVWANGTGCATDTYDGLLKKIAEAGYIVVADSSVMAADGSAQQNSIDYIISQNNSSSSVFNGKADTAKIGAAGHSQGGRSSVNAAQNDSRIKCIVSIAGASSAEEANGLKTPALFLTGTADMVVVSSQWCKPSYDAVSGKAVYASLKGGVHTTCMTNPERISEYVISWFDANLKEENTARAKFVNGGKLSTDSAWQDFACKN